MNVRFDARRLTQLAAAFQRLCGIHASIRGTDGRAICEGGPCPAFCASACSPGARPHCADCRACADPKGEAEGARICRCRAGLCAALTPIWGEERQRPIAWLCAGPFLDNSSDGEPVPGYGANDANAPRAGASELRSLSGEEQAALASMLEALADSIRARGLIVPAREGDLRRLERFLDEHYMEKLSLASVSAQLHIGRTRLCALAKELSGGQTLFAMIANRRISAAKALLARGNQPISAIAEAVGISDYNYFSKIFRSAVGVSPSEFRKQARRDLGDLV